MIKVVRNTEHTEKIVTKEDAIKHFNNGSKIALITDKGEIHFIAGYLAETPLGRSRVAYGTTSTAGIRNCKDAISDGLMIEIIDELLTTTGDVLDGWWQYFNGHLAKRNNIVEYKIYNKKSRNISGNTLLKDFE